MPYHSMSFVFVGAVELWSWSIFVAILDLFYLVRLMIMLIFDSVSLSGDFPAGEELSQEQILSWINITNLLSILAHSPVTNIKFPFI